MLLALRRHDRLAALVAHLERVADDHRVPRPVLHDPGLVRDLVERSRSAAGRLFRLFLRPLENQEFSEGERGLILGCPGRLAPCWQSCKGFNQSVYPKMVFSIQDLVADIGCYQYRGL